MIQAFLFALSPPEVPVAIRGIEKMSLPQVEQALREGACFVFYEYCISLFFITLRKPSDIYLLPPPRGNIVSFALLHLVMALIAAVSLINYAILQHYEVIHHEVMLWIAAPFATWTVGAIAYYVYKTVNDDRWHDETGLKRGLVFSLVSLLLGWWGVPWGVIYTPMTMFTNLSGGCDVTDEVWALLQSSAQ